MDGECIHLSAHALLEDHKCNYAVCDDCRGKVHCGKAKLDSLELKKKCHHEPHDLKAEHTPWWCDIKQGKFFSFEQVCHPQACAECQRVFVMQQCGSNMVRLTAITAVLSRFPIVLKFTRPRMDLISMNC